MDTAVQRTTFTPTKECLVSLIKWFSTVQQFLEKIVKCLGPLDQPDTCCCCWNGISKKRQKHPRRPDVWGFLNNTVWFASLLPSCLLVRLLLSLCPLVLRSQLHGGPCGGCKNHQAPVISFCWRAHKFFNSPADAVTWSFHHCFIVATVQRYWLKQVNKEPFVSAESLWAVGPRVCGERCCPKYWNLLPW